MMRPPPRSTLFPTRRSSDLASDSDSSTVSDTVGSADAGDVAQALKADDRSSDTTPNEADRKSTRLNSSHVAISYAVFCLKKKNVIFDSRLHIRIATV